MDFDFPTVFNRILKTKKPSKCTLRIGNSSKVQNFFNTIFKGASEESRILWARFAPEGMVCAFYFCMHAHAHALKSNPCDNIRREQARRKRLERVAQKIKKPGSATKQRERAADGNTVCASRLTVHRLPAKPKTMGPAQAQRSCARRRRRRRLTHRTEMPLASNSCCKHRAHFRRSAIKDARIAKEAGIF